MEIRRKVFSLLEDEKGEERSYSTNEFELESQENEKLFSTGDEELDNLLTEVYYSGIEDGYDYFSYEQRLFNRQKHNKRQQAANAQTHAAGKSGELVGNAERFAKIAPEIKEKHGGDIDKWIESLRKEGRWNEYKKYKSMFHADGPQRDGLKQVLNGIDPSKTEIVEKAAQSVEKATGAGADAIAALGKTRESFQTEAGNTFEVGGKKVNAKLDNTGSATVTTEAGVREGKRRTKTQSRSSNRRASVVNREVSMPENNMKVGGKKRGSVSARYKVKKNPNVPKGEFREAADVTSIGSNKIVNSSVKNGGKVNYASSADLIKDEAGKVIGADLKTNISNGITTTTRKTGQKESVMKKAGSWVKKHPGKAALIGTGLVATGALGAAMGSSKDRPRA